jgi:hypothetical protein
LLKVLKMIPKAKRAENIEENYARTSGKRGN